MAPSCKSPQSLASPASACGSRLQAKGICWMVPRLRLTLVHGKGVHSREHTSGLAPTTAAMLSLHMADLLHCVAFFSAGRATSPSPRPSRVRLHAAPPCSMSAALTACRRLQATAFASLNPRHAFLGATGAGSGRCCEPGQPGCRALTVIGAARRRNHPSPWQPARALAATSAVCPCWQCSHPAAKGAAQPASSHQTCAF